MERQPHIAVVDDHRDIRQLVCRYLREQGYRVSEADSAVSLERLMLQATPDLIVLDIMMPGEDGLSLCRRLRASGEIPIILLTALTEDVDRIAGLELGADDYLPKPFNPRELLARIRAVLRRAGGASPSRYVPRARQFKFDRWTFDVGRRELIGKDNVAVPLSTAEFRLLSVLIESPRHVLTRDQLLDLTAGKDTAEVFDRAIDNLVSRLRRKIEVDPRNPKLIRTHYGGGYSFAADVEAV
ncbi:response regulator [Lysobacter sp. CA199]|uniref:response regulator n=1 Tax=Lysobacter sp. CA199 TaxID=3455608 RepID=UPI003F8CF8F5